MKREDLKKSWVFFLLFFEQPSSRRGTALFWFCRVFGWFCDFMSRLSILVLWGFQLFEMLTKSLRSFLVAFRWVEMSSIVWICFCWLLGSLADVLYVFWMVTMLFQCFVAWWGYFVTWNGWSPRTLRKNGWASRRALPNRTTISRGLNTFAKKTSTAPLTPAKTTLNTHQR